MFSKIIVASEISPVSFEVIKCLKGLRKLGAKKCLLVQCLDPHQIDTGIASLFTSVLEENLTKQKEFLTDQGYEVETRVLSGFIKNEINRIASEEDFSIIVAAAAEHSMMGEIFSGGAAHEVIHHASRPVLLIRIPDNPEECDITDHILFPTDFSENAGKAFEYVKEMAAEGAKKVTLVHVQDTSRINEDISYRLEEFNLVDTQKEVEKVQQLAGERLKKFNEIDTKRLQEMKKQLQEKGNTEVDIQLLYGSPSAEIIRFIGELKIPLVVMGSQGRGFIKELYLGSVSHNVARHSSASVLLIPTNRER